LLRLSANLPIGVEPSSGSNSVSMSSNLGMEYGSESELSLPELPWVPLGCWLLQHFCLAVIWIWSSRVNG
jgi:hypothetical protein